VKPSSISIVPIYTQSNPEKTDLRASFFFDHYTNPSFFGQPLSSSRAAYSSFFWLFFWFEIGFENRQEWFAAHRGRTGPISPSLDEDDGRPGLHGRFGLWASTAAAFSGQAQSAAKGATKVIFPYQIGKKSVEVLQVEN
jgi:hypothetical protein